MVNEWDLLLALFTGPNTIHPNGYS